MRFRGETRLSSQISSKKTLFFNKRFPDRRLSIGLTRTSQCGTMIVSDVIQIEARPEIKPPADLLMLRRADNIGVTTPIALTGRAERPEPMTGMAHDATIEKHATLFK